MLKKLLATLAVVVPLASTTTVQDGGYDTPMLYTARAV